MAISPGYKGNILLKKSGTNIEWTPEMVEEWQKCAADPIYFTQNYIKIIHVDKGIINFIPYDYQEEIIQTVHNNRYTIVLTGRQSGKCLLNNQQLTMRNKKTGEIVSLTIGKLYDIMSKHSSENTTLESNINHTKGN